MTRWYDSERIRLTVAVVITVAVCAALCVPRSCVAATIVSGAIETATWDAAGSPYRVAGPCSVAAGQTLTIGPGVDVLFDADVPFVVRGTLAATGQPTDSVRFLPGEAPEWGGLRFIESEDSQLSYVRVSGGAGGDGGQMYSPGGAWVRRGSASFDHCVFSRNRSPLAGGGVLAWEANTVFTNCFIRDNLSGKKGGGVFVSDGAAVFEDCGVQRQHSRG